MSRVPAGLSARFAVHGAHPPSGDGPPPAKDRGDWTLEVEGRGYARPPVPVDFAGTVIHEKPDPFSTELDRKRRQREITKEKEKNRQILEEAVFILSQSATGRDVLEQMTKEGYKIVFDDRRTGERGAGGLCDPSDKMIVLRSQDNPEYLALLLGHEAVHAVQNTRHDLFPSTKHRPEVGIRLSFAIEADAYAQQTQIALELFYGDPFGPTDQIRYRIPLLQMKDRFPDIVAAAEKSLRCEDALQNGASVSAAFQAFYDNFSLRTFYEDAHISWADWFAPKVKGKSNWLQKNFNKDVESQWIKDRIQHRGKAYLNIHAPSLDFCDRRHSGVTDSSIIKLEAFYEKHGPHLKPDALPVYGVHMKDATRWILGLTSTTHAIFKNIPKPPKAA